MVPPPPSPATRIRPATRADRSALIAFHLSLYDDHQREVVPAGDRALSAYRDLAATLREDVDAMLASPDVVLLVAEEGGAPVGYATGMIQEDPRRTTPRRGVVGDWLVVPDARGRGVGRQLLEALLDAFRGRGCGVAESQTWPGNAGGRRAHEALGFREVRVVYRRAL